MTANESAAPRAAKKAIRAEVNAALLRMPPAERAAASDRLWTKLLEFRPWREARCVMLYAPMSVEPDLDRAWTNGALIEKKACYPCIVGRELEVRVVSGLNQLQPADFGLRAPGSASERIEARQLDLVVVPGLAFTAGGDRLGRGAGYYDRFLARLPAQVQTVAIAFPCQLREHLPVEPHDQRVGRVIIA